MSDGKSFLIKKELYDKIKKMSEYFAHLFSYLLLNQIVFNPHKKRRIIDDPPSFFYLNDELFFNDFDRLLRSVFHFKCYQINSLH
jgi:hypothetical protein